MSLGSLINQTLRLLSTFFSLSALEEYTTNLLHNLYPSSRWFTQALMCKCLWNEKCQCALVSMLVTLTHIYILYLLQEDVCSESELKSLKHFCLPPFSSSLSGKTSWRRPKLWWRTPRCWCPAQPPDRTGWHRPPSPLLKPSPSSQMWSNWELQASARTTLRRRSAALPFLQFSPPASLSSLSFVHSARLSDIMEILPVSFPKCTVITQCHRLCVCSLGGSDKRCQRCGQGAGRAH